MGDEAAALPDERRDHGGVPDHGGGVGEEKAAVAVEDAEAPGREHEQGRAGKEDADELDGKQARLALEAVGDDVHQRGGEEHTQQHEHRSDENQDGEDGGGGAGGLLVALFGVQARVDGDERCRKDAFAEEVLQHVGDAEGRLEGVGSHGVAEVVGEDALADESDELGEQDAGGDGQGGGAAVGLLRFGEIWQSAGISGRVVGVRCRACALALAYRSASASGSVQAGACGNDVASLASRLLWIAMTD